MDYIDRELLLQDISNSVVFSVRGFDNPEIRGAKKIIDRIRKAPVVDVVGVKLRDKQIDIQLAEIERLEQIIKDSHSICEDCKEKYAEEFEDAKSEARKEFAERLKKESRWLSKHDKDIYSDAIDNLLEEMESE